MVQEELREPFMGGDHARVDHLQSGGLPGAQVHAGGDFGHEFNTQHGLAIRPTFYATMGLILSILGCPTPMAVADGAVYAQGRPFFFVPQIDTSIPIASAMQALANMALSAWSAESA